MAKKHKIINPKAIVGSTKIPIHLWPNTATIMGCMAMLNGMLQYGRVNFRASDIKASTYISASKRHLDAWEEGEEVDPVDKVPHLGAALACIAIIIDSRAAGRLIDDRPLTGGYLELKKQLMPLVRELQQRHAGKTPRHYTIKDTAQFRKKKGKK